MLPSMKARVGKRRAQGLGLAVLGSGSLSNFEEGNSGPASRLAQSIVQAGKGPTFTKS